MSTSKTTIMFGRGKEDKANKGEGASSSKKAKQTGGEPETPDVVVDLVSAPPSESSEPEILPAVTVTTTTTTKAPKAKRKKKKYPAVSQEHQDRLDDVLASFREKFKRMAPSGRDVLLIQLEAVRFPPCLTT
jgi:hypothetical protein